MSKIRMSERDIKPAQRILLNGAVSVIQNVLDATMLGVILVDADGLSLHLKPGFERPVVEALSEVDLKQLRRMVEEHTE